MAVDGDKNHSPSVVVDDGKNNHLSTLAVYGVKNHQPAQYVNC